MLTYALNHSIATMLPALAVMVVRAFNDMRESAFGDGWRDNCHHCLNISMGLYSSLLRPKIANLIKPPHAETLYHSRFTSRFLYLLCTSIQRIHSIFVERCAFVRLCPVQFFFSIHMYDVLDLTTPTDEKGRRERNRKKGRK